MLIDPQPSQVALYLRLIEALDLRLLFCADTHSHPGRPSASPQLRAETQCVTVMGEEARVDGVSRLVGDGEVLDLEGLGVEALRTPGHTADSYCFAAHDRVFTGDTLLISGTGRTDLDGDARAQYDSLFNRLLSLPGGTLVYPGHGYTGPNVSTIADERQHNPRLQVSSVDEYVALMQGLAIEDPDLMDAPPRVSLRPSGIFGELLALRSAG
jgi:glyoxylase-like metal-dependent hydrolase (beta-lactamase superfamily II)